MEKRMLKFFAVVFALVLSSGLAFGEGKKADPTGTWHFNAPEAPYEYSTGDLVIKKTDGKYTAQIVYSEYYKMDTEDFKVTGDMITFKAYVEGDVVYFKGKMTGDKIVGKVSYSEGTLDISAERVKKKK